MSRNIDNILQTIDAGLEQFGDPRAAEVRRCIEEQAWAVIYERFEAGEYRTIDEATNRYLAWHDAWIGGVPVRDEVELSIIDSDAGGPPDTGPSFCVDCSLAGRPCNCGLVGEA